MEARVYAGKLGDIVVPHASTWPMTLIDLNMEAGATFDAPIPAGQRAFAHVLEGQATLGAEKRQANAGDVVWVAPSSGGDGDDALDGEGGDGLSGSSVRKPDHRRAYRYGRTLRHEYARGDTRGVRRPSGGTADPISIGGAPSSGAKARRETGVFRRPMREKGTASPRRIQPVAHLRRQFMKREGLADHVDARV